MFLAPHMVCTPARLPGRRAEPGGLWGPQGSMRACVSVCVWWGEEEESRGEAGQINEEGKKGEERESDGE